MSFDKNMGFILLDQCEFPAAAHVLIAIDNLKLLRNIFFFSF